MKSISNSSPLWRWSFLQSCALVLAASAAGLPGFTIVAQAAESAQAGRQPASVKAFTLDEAPEAPNDARSRGPEVVATGVGVDPQLATQNALINAVEQVVGILVDAETLVNNDQIVRDQVLTYSRGFVEDFTEIHRWQQDGLHYVRIRAQVSATRLGEKLKAQQVVMRAIEGDKIAIRIKVEELNEEQGRQMFRKAVADFTPDKVLTVTLADEKPAVERGPTGVKLTVSYRVAANLEAWNEIRANLVPVLEQIAPGKRCGSWLAKQGFSFSGTPLKEPPLYVFKEMGPDHVTTDWERYAIPKWLWPDVRALADRNSSRGGCSGIRNFLHRGYTVQIALLDEQEQIIARAERRVPNRLGDCGCPTIGGYLVFPHNYWGQPYPGDSCSIGPVLFTGGGFNKSIDLSETFTLATEDLARVNKVAASIEYRAP